MSKKESTSSIDDSRTEARHVPGPNELIRLMLDRLHSLKLYPSPVPRKVAERFKPDAGNIDRDCYYCGGSNAAASVPEIEFDLKSKSASLLAHRAICKDCNEIHSLKRLNNHMARAMMKDRRRFGEVYQHYLKVNEIEDHSSLSLQENISIANSVSLLYSEIPWKIVEH